MNERITITVGGHTYWFVPADVEDAQAYLDMASQSPPMSLRWAGPLDDVDAFAPKPWWRRLLAFMRRTLTLAYDGCADGQ